MLHYDVSFVKNLLSSNGQRFRCVQDVIAVDATSRSEAVIAATRAFEQRRSVRDWRTHADSVEVCELLSRRNRALRRSIGR